MRLSPWTAYGSVLETDTVQRILVKLSISSAKEDIQYIDYCHTFLKKIVFFTNLLVNNVLRDISGLVWTERKEN
jgi:hypothetical protein